MPNDLARRKTIERLQARLPAAGQEHHDLRTLLMHGLPWMSDLWNDHLGGCFFNTSFGAFDGDRDGWQLCAYHESRVCIPCAIRRRTEDDILQAIPEQRRIHSLLTSLLGDCVWVLFQNPHPAIAAIPFLADIQGKLYGGATSWIWLLHQISRHSFKGTILREYRRFPLIELRQSLRLLRDDPNSNNPRTTQEIEEAIADANSERYVSTISTDPFTASSAVFDLVNAYEHEGGGGGGKNSILTRFKHEDDVPAVYRVGGDVRGEPLTAAAAEREYGIKGWKLSREYKGTVTKLGNKHLYQYIYVAGMCDLETRRTDSAR
jgi:hypothetical protein